MMLCPMKDFQFEHSNECFKLLDSMALAQQEFTVGVSVVAAATTLTPTVESITIKTDSCISG